MIAFPYPIIKMANKFIDWICCNCYSELSLEYCERARGLARELLKAISESLGLEPFYIEKVMNLDKGLQMLYANFYPPCPQPELAMGLPPHSDHGLLSLVTHNGFGGFQLQHNGMWVNVNAIPNSFLVNIADQLEVQPFFLITHS